MPSPELQILIEAIRVVLLKAPQDKLLHLLNSPKIDWKRLEKMVVYHQIRPVVYEALRQVNFFNDFTENLAQYSKKQAVNNMVYCQEATRILSIFRSQNIPVLPYKGLLFLEKFYQNKPLREFLDFDIVVKPTDAVNALKILLNEGYELCTATTATDDALNHLIVTVPDREVALNKTTKLGLAVQIDFHWGISEVSHQQTIQLEELFDSAIISNFQGEQLLIPSNDSIFKMLLKHHGGRDCWLRLKNSCDLVAFLQSNPEMNILHLKQLAKETKLSNILTCGIGIAETYFYENAKNKVANPKVINQIVERWESATYWNTPSSKLKFNAIYRSLQDEMTSWQSYLMARIRYYAIVNPYEQKRLVVFDNQYVLLNASSKLVSYLWYRFTGAK